MFQKILLLSISLLLLTACSAYSVDAVKPTITNGLKTILQTKNDVQLAVIPDGDKEITIDGKTHVVKGETFKAVEDYLSANNKVEQAIIDLLDSQITDENIATIAYYADKYSVPVKDLLQTLTKSAE